MDTNEQVTLEDEPAVTDITVAGTDLSFVGPHPEATDVVEAPTWFDIINAAIGA